MPEKIMVINKEVVKELMKLTPRQLRIAIAQRHGWACSVFGNWDYQMFPPNGDGFHVQNCPNYSEDITEAWKLVEEMQEKGLYFDVSAERDEAGNYFKVRVLNERRYYSYSYGSVVCKVKAPTAPFAISRAWLLTQLILEEGK